jgi:ActR/RegA family two-component response regulator
VAQSRLVPGTALIIDDDPKYVTMLARVATRLGLACTDVADASAAIARLQTHDYDVIFLDLQLAGSNGGTVANFMRRAKPHLLARTLVVTSYPAIARAVTSDLPTIDKGDLSELQRRIAVLLEGSARA